MKRIIAPLCAAALLAGCAVGPRYRPAPVVPESSQIGAVRGDDSIQAFFDSLSAARAADSAYAPGGPLLPPRQLSPDSLADLAWLDVLRDTTLIRLERIALLQNRDLAVARARIEEFRAGVGSARSPLLPNLAVNGSASKNQVVFGNSGAVTYPAYRLTADLAWELDFWGGSRRGVQAAQADLAAQREAERATVLSLVSAVASSYLELLELDQERAVAEQTLASRKATLDLARARFRRGLISELDVRQFEAQVEQLRSEQEHALDVLLGDGPVQVPRGGSLAGAARAVVVPDSVPAALIARRPDVGAAERSYAAATARIGMADAARLPSFSVVGSYGTQAPTPGTMFNNQNRVYELLGGISIPIFSGGRLESAAQAARAQAEEARARYEQTVLVALSEVRDALTGVREARDVAAAQETQAVSLRRALELAELRYDRGVSNYLEVLDAQRSLFDAELAASQAELGQLTAAVRLYKALGGSWPGTGARR